EPGKRVVRRDHALVITLASDPSNRNSARNRPDSIYNRQPTNRMGVVWMLRSEFAKASVEASARRGSSETQPRRADASTLAIDVLCDALAEKRPVVCVSRLDADLIAALRLRQEYPMRLTLAG